MKENIEELKKCLNKLNERDRMIIVLYYYEEWEIKKIAEYMKATPQRIRQIIKKTLEKLRIMMK